MSARAAADDAMTVEEWAKLVRLKRATAYKRVADGEIEAINIGSPRRPILRITTKAHQAYLASRRMSKPGRRRAA